MSQKIFDTQSWQVVRFSHIDSVGKVKFGSEISMKTFFQQNFFMFINKYAHVLHHPETVQDF